MLRSIADLVGEVSQEWKTRVFRYDDKVFSLPLQPEWLGSRLVVGLRGQPDHDAEEWMAQAAIASQTKWTQLTDLRVPGAPRRRIEEAKEFGLRSSAGYTLFSITVTDEFIVAGQSLVISNANSNLQARRPQEIVLFIRG